MDIVALFLGLYCPLKKTDTEVSPVPCDKCSLDVCPMQADTSFLFQILQPKRLLLSSLGVHTNVVGGLVGFMDIGIISRSPACD